MPVLLPMMANQGVVRCYGLPDLKYRGAIARTSPQYRGEAYVSGGAGAVRLVTWSPNKAVVDYWNLEPGASVVFNTNYDKGWLANGARAEPVNDAVGVKPTPGNGRVTFRYFPRSLAIGLWIFGAAVVVIGAFAYAARLRRRRAQKIDVAVAPKSAPL